MAESAAESPRPSFKAFNTSELESTTDPERSRQRLLEAQLHDETDRGRVLDLLDDHGADLASRSTLPGHLTGSALVIDSSGASVILLLHSKLGRWLQPGGHADGDHELAGVALREATEETGIRGLKVLVPAVDLDIHEIPARGEDPAHLHLDLRFAVISPEGARPEGNEESRELRWVPVERVSELTDEPGIHRLLDRAMDAYRSYRATLPSGDVIS